MTRDLRRRAAIIAIYLAVTLALVWGVHAASYRQALSPLRERGEADLALTVDRLTSQMQRYQDLAVLMAAHPALRNLARQPASTELREAASDLLLNAADRTTALNIAYLSPTGELLAAARPETARTVASPAFRNGAEFRRALTGALGWGIGPSGTDGTRSYLFAAPSYAPEGGVSGVLLVAVDVDLLEQAWRGDNPAVWFTDPRGRIFISNRSELLNWTIGDGVLTPPDGGPLPFERRLIGDNEVWRAPLGNYVPDPALVLMRDAPQVGMRATALVAEGGAARIAMLQAAVAGLVLLAFGALLFWATERRRVLAVANALLENRVAERTAELSGANNMLRREVAERQEAEAALKRAQAELVQAGKLSALGQMSAGLSHELNQPLMAIRQFAENGTLLVERGKVDQAAGNLTRISELAGRMGRIIRNLRAFARQESEPARPVDLGQIVATALEMTEARLAKDGITLDWQPPQAPVQAMAGEVRLAQVMVNLITNAADAMADGPRRDLTITLTPSPRPTIRVSDTGTGIAQPERIFDPFYSTKEVGAAKGMGLGLSISYGMIQSFGGEIRGRNRKGGGAEFVIELPAVRDELAAE
ncbi:sensor histidine kinase [Pseudooceanicola onchidii]|uniref:sensor histidine kinase n=1 Tax=Pseudooceanicola onchidii TaxID=2562279 RepID=UPI0010AACE1A|nr:ATP-binding protein [Pseudooceanicola onchidii]